MSGRMGAEQPEAEQRRRRVPGVPGGVAREAGAAARLPRPARSSAGPERTGGEESGTVYETEGGRRPGLAGVVAALADFRARLPKPRLTGLGAGLLATLTALAVAGADAVLFDGSPGAYGFFFLLVAAACAGWVRQADLIVGPVAVPIAYAAGIACISDGSVMGFFSTLSLEAGWLYAATLLAILIALVRRIAYMAARRR